MVLLGPSVFKLVKEAAQKKGPKINPNKIADILSGTALGLGSGYYLANLINDLAKRRMRDKELEELTKLQLESIKNEKTAEAEKTAETEIGEVTKLPSEQDSDPLTTLLMQHAGLI